jgi:CheY-specific phosphatase CheX
MSKLPSTESLAALVSHVTQTMCGVTFVPGDPLARGESICLQMVMIPLRGDPDITVVVSSDAEGSRALGAAFFGSAAAAVTQGMIDDAIAELLNMVAGQISTALGSAHLLGLPVRTSLAEIAKGRGLRLDDAALLRSEGEIDLGLWILEREAPDASLKTPGTRGGFRSLLRRIAPPR